LSDEWIAAEKNMKKKITLLTLCAMLFALSLLVWAQHPKKVPRIGYLSTTDPAAEAIRSEPFSAALRELGYIEGQNIAIEYRYAEGKADRFSALAAELVRLRVDIILVGGDRSIRAAKNATKTIPIIMTGSGLDPVKEGHVESLARPGGNVTGITSLNRELAGKRLELLKEAVPKVARVAVLYDLAIQGTTRELKEDVPVAARALGLTVQPWEVRAADDFDKLFAALNKQRPDGLFVLGGGPLMRANQGRIVGFALKSRLPSMYAQKEYVDTWWADVLRGGRRGHQPARRLLRG
jgi:putative ABC transport system substrate-binding protein